MPDFTTSIAQDLGILPPPVAPGNSVPAPAAAPAIIPEAPVEPAVATPAVPSEPTAPPAEARPPEPGEPAAAPEVEPEDEFEFSDERPPAPPTETPTLETEPATEPEPSAPPLAAAQPAAAAEPPLSDEDRAWIHKHEGTLLATARGKKMLQAFKRDRAISAPVEQGGIAHTPTVEQIRDYYAAHSDMEAMHHGFESGIPERAEEWLTYWLGGDDGKIRPGAETVVARIPEFLERIDPGLYARVALPIMDRFLNGPSGLYTIAQTLQGDDQARLLDAARIVEKRVFGKIREDIPAAIGAAPASGQDPLAAEKTRLLAAQTRLDRERLGLQGQRWQEFDNRVTAAIESSIDKDISEALSPAAKAGYTPATITALRNEFKAAVHSALQRDPEFNRNMQIAVERASRTMTRQDHESLVSRYRQSARNLIRQNRESFLKNIGVSVVKKSEERHQQLAVAAAQTSVVSPAGSVAPPESARMPQRQGESASMARARRIAADMAATLGA